MAVGKADVPTAERDRLAAEILCLVGRQWGRSSATGYPRWTTDGATASADASATDFDASLFLKDDYDHIPSKPSSAAIAWYLNFDLGSEQGEIDCFAILAGHNLGTIGGVLVEVQVADDATFATNLRTIYSVTPASNKRILSFVIKEGGDTFAQRFTSVRYLRIKFSKGLAFTPELTEVWLGRRRQLFFEPLLPFDPAHHASAVRLVEGDTGIAGASKRYANRRMFDAGYTVKDSTAIADFLAFFKTDTDGGVLPFLVCEDPAAAPTDFYLMRWQGDAPELVGPSHGFGERRFEIHAIEHGKNLLAAGL